MEVIEFIDKIRAYDMHGVLENFFTSGYCYYFASILQERFGGEIVYDPVIGHFYFLKDDIYYDYNGSYCGEFCLWTNSFMKKEEWMTSKTIVEGCILKTKSDLS